MSEVTTDLPLQVMSNEEYHQAPGTSSTTIKIFGSRSPFHARQAKLNPPKPTDAMDFGTAMHARGLEPELFYSQFIKAPVCDRRTKEGKAIYAEFLESAKGKTVVDAGDYEIIERIGEQLDRDPEIKSELSGGQAEGSAFWEDPNTGVLCKCRPDYYRFHDDVIIDLKTTENAAQAEFARVLANLKYHWSAQWYVRGISEVMQRPVKEFKFLVVEKKPPFGYALYTLHHSALDKAEQDLTEIMRRYQACERNNEWPSYPKFGHIYLPSWGFGDIHAE